MALISMRYFSYYLNLGTEVEVIIPEDRSGSPTLTGKRYPVLYLLHGHSDDCLAWLRHTNIEDLANEYGFIVVMPTTHRAYYTDALYGHKYGTFISKELVDAIDNTFPTIKCRGSRYIAGLSMGGFGALKLSMENPDRFSMAASFSGAVDPFATELLTDLDGSPMEDKMRNLENIFGTRDYYYKSDNYLNNLALKYKAESKDKYPIAFYASCGTEDPLFRSNKAFIAFANENGFDIELDERPGNHNWDFWSVDIKQAFEFFTKG